MRLPRKIKKGWRTLNGLPRTKWQRRSLDAYSRFDRNIYGLLVHATWQNIVDNIMCLLYKDMPPGGIRPSQIPQVNNEGEMVMTKDESKRLSDLLNTKTEMPVRCEVIGDLEEGIKTLRIKPNLNPI